MCKKIEFPVVNPSDIAYILSTSGSTGNSKAVMITHANVVSVVYAFYDKFRPIVPPSLIPTNYTFLPLQHAYGLLADLLIFLFGGRTAYPSGNVRLVLMSDIQVLLAQAIKN